MVEGEARDACVRRSLYSGEGERAKEEMAGMDWCTKQTKMWRRTTLRYASMKTQTHKRKVQEPRGEARRRLGQPAHTHTHTPTRSWRTSKKRKQTAHTGLPTEVGERGAGGGGGGGGQSERQVGPRRGGGEVTELQQHYANGMENKPHGDRFTEVEASSEASARLLWGGGVRHPAPRVGGKREGRGTTAVRCVSHTAPASCVRNCVRRYRRGACVVGGGRGSGD